MEYTKENLIEICEKSFIPQEKWNNRNSAMSQIALGQCYALLKAGCEFEIQYTEDSQGCNTDDRIIWVQFWVKDFMYFEGVNDDKRGNANSDYHFYLPTKKRINEVGIGNDWY